MFGTIMTTCARRQEPDLMGDDQGQPASKQDPAAGWLAGWLAMD